MLIGLDLGTTNVKAVLTDGALRVRGAWSKPIALRTGAGGLAEQDLAEMCSAAEGVLGLAAASAAGPVRAVGVSAQGGALQRLDAAGAPDGPVVSWLDARGHPHDSALLGRHGASWFAQRIGHPGPGLAVGQALRLRAETGSEVRLGFVGDQVVRALCGRAAHDGTSAALTLLYNPAERAYDADVLRLAGLAPDRLPPLVDAAEPAGALLPAVAARTGLPPGIPVSAAIHDQYAAALACGAVEPGDVMLGTGTAWVLLAVTGALSVPAGADAYVCHHVARQRWGHMLPLHCGGAAVTWALQCLGMGNIGGDALDAVLEAAPPGSEGITFWPYLASPPPDADGSMRGRYAGLQMRHGREHLLRAVVEGLACEVARGLGVLRGAGAEARALRLTGSAARSRVTPAVLAGLTGLPIACAPAAESALGAAVLARALAEPGQDLATLAREAAPPADVVAPGSDGAKWTAVLERYVEGLR